MKAELCLLFCCLSIVYADMMGECAMAAFYQELGCSPNMGDSNAKCPVTFTCPDLHPDPKLCYYRGKSYSRREMIPQNLVLNPCSKVCSCTTMNNSTYFNCAAVDCVESFDSNLDQCVYTYELDSCCSTETVCGKDDIAKLKTCEFEGKTYKEGIAFYPDKTNRKCICTGQWNGSIYDVPYCNDINCGIEIHFQDELMKKCAPIFLANQPMFCPIGFECPTNSSKQIRGMNLNNIKLQCAFGNMTLSVGDEVIVENKCLKCTCEVPPFATCIQGPKNDQETANC